MQVYTRNARIEWGDCDPAGIVFFPRYFAMFDSSNLALREREHVITKDDYVKA